MEHYERVCARVDLDAIADNVKMVYEKSMDKKPIMAVIKTDGYGHGALPIARTLENKDYVMGFAAATAEEALILRKAGIKKEILILGYVFPYAYEELIENDVTLTVFKEDMIADIEEAAKKVGKKCKVHIKVDTGMHRIGIGLDDKALEIAGKIIASKYIEAEGIFTHFATADENDMRDYLVSQINAFDDMVLRISEKYHHEFKYIHCYNSAATLLANDIQSLSKVRYTFNRMGITMYGLLPSKDMEEAAKGLKGALSLYSHIVYIKDLPEGMGISYGKTYVTKRDTRLATVPVGYGDGYPRGLSGKGYVLIRGKKAPILGRVCMDQFMVDVTDIEGVKEYDKVTLIGQDGDEKITVEDLCDFYGGFNYEVVCDIGRRVPREYYKNGELVYAKDYHNDIK